MKEIELKLDENGTGAFIIEEEGEAIAEMAIGISGNNLTVYHTEVSDELQGQGIASELLSRMIEYARENNFKVIASCSYVKTQFKRHADEYRDVLDNNSNG